MKDSGASSEKVLELAEEFLRRYRRGERPPLAEYIARYPELAADIREVFPAMAMIERVAIDEDPLNLSTAATAETELTQIGDFRIIREVGRGGMGIVYEAEQVSLGRRVAVKVLPKSVFNRDKVRRRFARESKAAAMLHHTNIVPVFGVGEHDGMNYYVMQFIQGQGLDQVLLELRRLRTEEGQGPSGNAAGNSSRKSEPAEQSVNVDVTADCSAEMVARSMVTGQFAETAFFPTRVAGDSSAVDPTLEVPAWDSQPRTDETRARARSETLGTDSQSFWRSPGNVSRKSKRHAYYQSVARMGVQIADALQHAHQQGIVHRDVKPSNLLLDTHGNVWVTDFGLAKASDQQDLTHTGDVLGTLRYMAPEQFHGKADQRTDVYALGLTLYEMLSLQPAFDSRDRNQLVKQVATESPTPLKLLDGQLPVDLTTIIQKAIDRDPSHRYQSAQELEDDLNRFLNDEPIRARRTSPVIRLARWSRKNPAVATLAAAVAALLLIVAVGSSLAAMRFERLAEKNSNLVHEKGVALEAATEARDEAEKDRQLALVAQNQAEIAQDAAEAARDTEKTLREEAERQRDRANTNANRARRAVDQYLSKITDNELLTVPGFQPLRQDLLNEAMKFYAEFTKETSDDPELQLELAKANFRLGAIHRELGNSEAATNANTAAIQQLESLRDRQFGGQAVLESLAEAYFFARRYQDTIQLCEQILQSDPTAVNVQSTLAETYNSLAIKTERDSSKVLAYHQKAYAIRRQLVEQQPESAEFNAELATTMNNLGVVLGDQGKLPDALSMYELSLTYLEKAIQLAPYSILYGRWYANSLRNASAMHYSLEQRDQSLEYRRKLIDVRRKLVHQNPAVGDLYKELYQDLLLLANQQREMGLSTESRRSYRDAQVVLTQIPRETPEELFELAVVYASLVEQPSTGTETNDEDPDAADERTRNLDLAMQALQQAVDKGWCDASALEANRVLDALRDRRAFQDLADVVEKLGEAKRLLAIKEEVTEQQKLANQQQAAKILNDLSSAPAATSNHARALATTMHALGTAQTGLGLFAEAEQSLNEAVKMRASLQESAPQDPATRLDWLTSRMAQGELHWQQGQFPEAHRIWQECLKETYAMSTENRDNRDLQQRIASLEFSCINRYGAAGLLPYVWDYMQRRIEFDTVRFDSTAASTLLFEKDRELLRKYHQEILPRIQSIAEDDYARVHLLRTTSLSQTATPNLDWLITRSENVGKARNDPSNIEPFLAAAQGYLFKGDLESAEQTISQHIGSGAPSVLAMIAFRQGRADRARQLWEAATKDVHASHQQMLRLNWLKDKNHYVKYWHLHWYVCAMWRQSTELLFDGQGPSVDPWLHLILARGYKLIGETRLAEENLDSALAAAPNDTTILAAAIEVADESSLNPRLEQLHTQSVASADPQDPLPLIRRGRWYAERGDLKRAEEDYAKAAAISPNELNKFLEAGWWVIGPYPSVLREFCPPEFDPNPAVPLTVIDPKSGISDEPVAWQSCSIRPPFAPLDESKLAESQSWSEGTAYALAHVYAPDERSTSLVLRNDTGAAAVWVNGQELAPAREDSISWLTIRHVPFTLHPGLNRVLVKFSAKNPVQIALDDFPLIRAFDGLKFAALQQAAEAFSLASTRYPTDGWPTTLILAHGSYAAETCGDSTRLQELTSKLLLEWRRNPSAVDIALAMELLNIRDAASTIGPEDTAKLLQQFQEVWSPEAYPHHYGLTAVAQYRLGKFPEAIEFGEKNLEPRFWPLLAMAHHRLGDAIQAEQWLAKSSNLMHSAMSNLNGNHALWLCTPLYREALELIRGDSIDFDIDLDMLLTERSRLWNERDPLTAAFDRGVEEAPNNPHTYIARGKRLVGLGRIEEAARDFDQAVELKPGDVEVLLARATFQADLGRIERAANDVEQIFQIGFGNDYPTIGFDVESQIAARETLLRELLRRHPNNSAFHRLDGDRLAHLGKWTDARTAYTTGDPYWSHEMSAAAISALLHDTQGYAEAWSRAERLWAWSIPDPIPQVFNRGRMQLLVSRSHDESEKLLKELALALRSSSSAEHLGLLGIAQLRAGRYSEAVATLDSAIHSGSPIWHNKTYHWPAYAMALWHSGDQANAREFLAKSADHLLVSRRVCQRERRVGGAQVDHVAHLSHYALHHEARTLIDGPESADNELSELLQTSAETAQPTEQDLVLSLLNRAVERSGDDPGPLLRRARWYAAYGEHDKAAADLVALEHIAPEGHPLNLLAGEKLGSTQRIWDFSVSSDIWPDSSQCEVVASKQAITLKPTGPDPLIQCSVNAPAGLLIVSLCVRTSDELNNCQIFWATRDEPLMDQVHSVLFTIPPSETWQVIRVLIKAESELRSLRFDLPNQSDKPLELAWIHLAQDAVQESRLDLDPELSKALDGIAVSHSRAEKFFAVNEIASAAEVMEQDLAAFPYDAEGWTRLALYYAELGQYDRSTKALASALDHALSSTPSHQLHVYHALALTANERYDEAISELSALVDSPDPNLSDAILLRAEIQRCVAWLLKGDLESHRRRCSELLKSAVEHGDRKHASAVVACCRFHPHSVDDWTDVLRIAEESYEQDSTSWDVRYNLFDVLCHAGRAKEALDRFAAYRNDDHPSLAMRFASCDLQLENPDPARKALQTFDLASFHGEHYPNLKLLRQQLSEQLAAFDQQKLESQSSEGVVNP